MSNNIYVEKIKTYEKIFSYNKKLPDNWQSLFQKEQPLVVDVGSGSGKFLLEKAKKDPTKNYIGIEIRYKRLCKARQKYIANSLDNIFLVQRRIKLLSELFSTNSLRTIFVLFPDPWAKAKQLKHRLLCQKFFQDAYILLQEGGNLFFTTDHCEYFFSIKKLIEKSKLFSIKDCWSLNRQEKDDDIITEFKTLFLSKNQLIYAINLIKK